MSIPFDADWRRLCTAADSPAVLARWATVEPTLAGQDLDGLRCRARSHDSAVSDPVLAALLHLAANDRLARRVIVEALMGRLIPMTRRLAQRGGEQFDDVLVELAGWAWELAATIGAERWSAQLASNLARLTKRRYLSTRCQRPISHLEDAELPDPTDAYGHLIGACDVGALLGCAVAAGALTSGRARVLGELAMTGGADCAIASRIASTPAATKKGRERGLSQLRAWPRTTDLLVA